MDHPRSVATAVPYWRGAEYLALFGFRKNWLSVHGLSPKPVAGFGVPTTCLATSSALARQSDGLAERLWACRRAVSWRRRPCVEGAGVFRLRRDSEAGARARTRMRERRCGDRGSSDRGLPSDWHAWKGHDPVAALPHIPGMRWRERSPRSAPASRAGGWGIESTVPFVCGCGVCEYCTAGDAQVCPDQTQPGFTGPGSFAERVAIRAADVNVVALPESIDFVTAASSRLPVRHCVPGDHGTRSSRFG